VRVTTVEGLAQLPNGTKFVSDDDCLWAHRYAGIRWKKHDGLSISSLDKYDNLGFDQTTHISYLPAFKDPLPVRVIEENND